MGAACYVPNRTPAAAALRQGNERVKEGDRGT